MNNKVASILAQVEEDCDCDAGCNICKAKKSRYLMYHNAGIPISYWTMSWKKFSGDPNFKNLISTILKDTPSAFKSGQSYAFVGALGTGKSYAICSILKMALVTGYNAKYSTMSDIINHLSTPGYIDSIMSVDWLGIDEFDQRWVFPSEKAEALFGSTMENILRTRFQNGMPTVISSNTSEVKDVLTNDFAKAFESLMSKYMKQVSVGGKDFRKAKKEQK